jgi:hypothetical protein
MDFSIALKGPDFSLKNLGIPQKNMHLVFLGL